MTTLTHIIDMVREFAHNNVDDIPDELYAALKDAARYRLLRQHTVDCYIASGRTEDLDASIDAWGPL